MRRLIVTALLLLLVIIGTRFAFSTQNDTPDSSDTNQILQEAVFTDLDGEEVRISDFAGKTILIDIWETWCTPCLRSMPTLQQLMDDYPDDFVVLAVSPGYMDSPEDVHSFVENNDYDFAFVFGEEFSNALQVQSLPYKVYVDPDGKYISTFVGSVGPEEDYEKTRRIIEDHF